jgi:hypothetical protein
MCIRDRGSGDAIGDVVEQGKGPVGFVRVDMDQAVPGLE